MSSTFDTKSNHANQKYLGLTQHIDDMLGRVFVDLGYISFIHSFL